jgi:hypothetical protein
MYSIQAHICKNLPEQAIDELPAKGFSTKTNDDGYTLISVHPACDDSDIAKRLFPDCEFIGGQNATSPRHALMSILDKYEIKTLVFVDEDSDGYEDNECHVFDNVGDNLWAMKPLTGSLRQKLSVAFEITGEDVDPFYAVGLGSVRSNSDIMTPPQKKAYQEAELQIDNEEYEVFKADFEKKTEAERALVLAKVFKPASIYSHEDRSHLPKVDQLERFYGVEFS